MYLILQYISGWCSGRRTTRCADKPASYLHVVGVSRGRPQLAGRKLGRNVTRTPLAHG